MKQTDLQVLFVRFPFGASEHPATTDWMIQTVLKAKADPRISVVRHLRIDDTPITMGRNRALKVALEGGFDLVCMIDSDMHPDLGGPGSQPFWDSSLEFMLHHDGPCCVMAPYCGPPPWENVYVFRWATRQSDHPNCDIQLDQYSREDASVRGGFEEIGAGPTGIILIDMAAIGHPGEAHKLAPPWFEYNYTDPPYNTAKSCTEDVFFTRNLSLMGIPQYVNWDAWAGHYKTKCVGKPMLICVEDVVERYREAILSGRHKGEKVMDIPALPFPAGTGRGRPATDAEVLAITRKMGLPAGAVPQAR